MKINLFSFSHAKCSGDIRKLVYCTDGGKEDKSPARGRKRNVAQGYKVFKRVKKISPLQGDGNSNESDSHILSWGKEDKSPARGRKLLCLL